MKPRRAVRRFDVFAEYNRLKGLEEGLPQDEAMGYGLWLAKLVAARRFSRPLAFAKDKPEKERQDPSDAPKAAEKWRTLGDEEQTDALFEKEVIERMGRDFYQEVFSPAVQAAYREGKEYEEIRDSIRADWKPEPRR